MGAGPPLLTGPHTLQLGGAESLHVGPPASRCHSRTCRPTWQVLAFTSATLLGPGHVCQSREQWARSRERICDSGLSLPLCEMGTGLLQEGGAGPGRPIGWWLVGRSQPGAQALPGWPSCGARPGSMWGGGRWWRYPSVRQQLPPGGGLSMADRLPGVLFTSPSSPRNVWLA